MGYRFRVYDDLGIVYKKVWGVYDDAASREAHDLWDAMCRERPEIGNYNEFQDLRHVTHYDVSIDQIRQLAAHYSQERATSEHQPKRMSYLAPARVAFGTGRVYGALMDTTGINFRVFDEVGDAAEWIGLTMDEAGLILENPPDQDE